MLVPSVRLPSLALALAAGLAVATALAPRPADAGGFDKKEGDAEKFNEKASEDALKGFEAYRKRDYQKARPLLEKALEAGHEADTCRSFLARIAFFYAEDDVARDHLSKIAGKTVYDKWLEIAIEGPYRKVFGGGAMLTEGKSPKGRYFLVTDVGYDPKQWEQLKPQIEALERKAETAKKPPPQLEALRKTRSEGWTEVAQYCDLIYEEYSKVFKFPKDEKLVSRVIVCRERGDYLDFGKALGFDEVDKTGGFYRPFMRLLVVNASETGKKYKHLWQSGREVLFHEAFHQFIDYYIENSPTWFNEGLATFFMEYDEDPRTGRLQLGPVRKTPIGAMGMTDYQVVVGALKPTAKDPLVPLDKLTADEAPDFYEKEKMYVRYAQSWGVIRFLVEAHPKGKKILIDYFKALKEGKNAAEAQKSAFKGEDWPKLEKLFKAYFDRL